LRFVHYPSSFVVDEWTRDLSLEVTTHRQAVGVPSERLPEGAVFGALYGRDGQLLPDSQRSKRGRSLAANARELPAGLTENAKRVGGQTFFGGQLNPVFGHVLLEVVARFWPDLAYGEFDRIALYASPRQIRSPRKSLTPPVLELLSAAGVPTDRLKLFGRRPVIFANVTLSTPPIVIKRCADPRLVAPYDRIAQVFQQQHEASGADALPARIYLSRSHLASGSRQALNESAIEAMALSRGFTIVHPQELPIGRQVALAHNAEIIAGCDGSAMHLAVFARPGTRLLALDSRIAVNQFMIDQARGLDAVHMLALDQVVEHHVHQWSADLDRVAAGLDLIVDGSGS